MSRVNIINGSTSTLLDFEFTTENGATGNFTLDTSITDSDPTIGAGLFEDAVTDVEYPFFEISEPGPLDLETFFNTPEVVIFSVQSFGNSDSLGFLDVYLDYDNPDRLSDNPDDYFISQTGDFAGYGGFIEEFDPPQGRFSIIEELTVTKLITGTDKSDILLGTADNDKLKGLNGNDFLFGKADDDVLDGGADDDLLFGGRGDDQFVLREGDGLDTIFDYRDGKDSFLLADGLAFEDLTIAQGFGQSLISVTETNEDLAALFGVNASDIGAEDFSTLV
jgi:Ca2+-binding RTX toxin-like protein